MFEKAKIKSFLNVVLVSAAFYASAGNGKSPRVISLSPSITEIICKLGKQDSIVGRSSVCDYPESVTDIPVAGEFAHPNLEKVVLLKPDVLVTSSLRDMSVKTSLEQLNIKCVLLPAENISDYFKAVEKIGSLLGEEERARAESERVSKTLEKIAENSTGEKARPGIYVEVWHKPLMTVGNRSFINELIEIAGGVNLASEISKDYFSCSPEWIVISNPDIIICPAMGKGGAGKVKSRDGWKKVNAVLKNRIYTEINEDLLYRLGPRITEAAELLSRIVRRAQESEKK